MTDLAIQRTALYRLLDTDGELIYIGVAVNPSSRWVGHAAEKAWWPEVATYKVVWFDNRAEALAAETAAISTERPRYNSSNNPDARRGDGKFYRRTLGPSPSEVMTDAQLQALADVADASEAHAAAVNEEKVRQAAHHAAIVAALEAGVGPSAIARTTSYDRNHVDRIRKAAGIPPRRRATVRPIAV